ncbi:MAG: hypothetical protein KDE27_28445, partial [Planctomycetes bacterium]|nr:hypothetical protein [Planctomycetota bacterium]
DLAADPVVTFYRAAAAFKRGGAGWDAAQRDLKRLTLSQRQDGELRGSWDPASGAFAEWGGRLGVSAVDVLVLEIYYRYCRLGVFTF